MENECIGCGCTKNYACMSSNENCHWLRIDKELSLGVCSSCLDQVKSLLNKAGLEWATFSTFSDSLIIYLHQHNVATKDIVNLFNYRSRETVLSRINGNIVTLGEAINKVYARVPVTGHNK